MAWRERLAALFNDRHEEWRLGQRESVSAGDTVLALPTHDRIALARELLANTGMVVARDVGVVEREDAPEPNQIDGDDDAWVNGWNDCRAAMMGEGE
jgi:hypothetical protein